MTAPPLILPEEARCEGAGAPVCTACLRHLQRALDDRDRWFPRIYPAVMRDGHCRHRLTSIRGAGR